MLIWILFVSGLVAVTNPLLASGALRFGRSRHYLWMLAFYFFFFLPAKPSVCWKLSLLMDVCAWFLMSVKFQPALRRQLCQWDLTRLQEAEKMLVCCRLGKGLPGTFRQIDSSKELSLWSLESLNLAKKRGASTQNLHLTVLPVSS